MEMRTFITQMKVCTNCGSAHTATQQQGNFIDGGLSVDLLNMGHYGGMWDNFPAGGREGTIHLCHDCALILMRTFPVLAKIVMPNGAGHPNMNEIHSDKDGTAVPSCCEFAWTWNNHELDEDGQYQVYHGTADGGWVKEEREKVS
jgi:hypothetical protein